jgi:hypothetical protein
MLQQFRRKNGIDSKQENLKIDFFNVILGLLGTHPIDEIEGPL